MAEAAAEAAVGTMVAAAGPGAVATVAEEAAVETAGRMPEPV